jgi:hypothetical protein
VSAQSIEALARANRTRLGIAAVRAAVRAHELSIEAALLDPRARSMGVARLLIAQYGWGDDRVARALTSASSHLWESPPRLPFVHRAVGSLTERERAAIVQACKETGR